MNFRFRIVISLITMALLAIIILYYAKSIDAFMQNSAAAQVLLLTLILVDAIGVVLTPLIERWIEDTRERNRRLTEESIAKLELNPTADDEHILTIPSDSSIGYSCISTSEGPKTSRQTGTKPPYYQEMKACLENYSNLWKLVQELPVSYRNTKKDNEDLVNLIAKDLDDFSTIENLDFPYQLKSDVISKLANKVRDNLSRSANTKWKYRVIYDEIGHEATIDGVMIQVPKETANKLAEKMDELRKDSAYAEKSEKILINFGTIQQKTKDFAKERDAIVEEMRLSSYKDLKRAHWWKKLKLLKLRRLFGV